MTGITPPPQCPACGYDGKTHPNSEKPSPRYPPTSPFSSMRQGRCWKCGVVWWEHALAQAREEIVDLRRGALDWAEEKLRLGERIAELEATLSEQDAEMDRYHKRYMPLAGDLATMTAAFLEYDRTMDRGRPSVIIAAGRALCKTEWTEANERCHKCGRTLVVMPGDSEGYCEFCRTEGDTDAS